MSALFSKVLKQNMTVSQSLLQTFIEDDAANLAFAKSAEAMVACLKAGGKIITCGNGGSHCDAMHLAEELLGRYRKNRRALAGVAISDPSFISCVGNDYGYEKIFSRYVEGMGRPGDILVGISTSGRSPNVLAAAREAREKQMLVIGLGASGESELSKQSDFFIGAPRTEFADRVQEIHIQVIHAWIECIERALFPDLYVV